MAWLSFLSGARKNTPPPPPGLILAPGDKLDVDVLETAHTYSTQLANVEVTDQMGNTITGTLIIATPANIVPATDTFTTLTAKTGTQATITLSLSNTGGLPGAPTVSVVSMLTAPGATTAQAVDLGWTLLDTGAIAAGAKAVPVRIQTELLPTADVGTVAVTVTVGTAA